MKWLFQSFLVLQVCLALNLIAADVAIVADSPTVKAGDSVVLLAQAPTAAPDSVLTWSSNGVAFDTGESAVWTPPGPGQYSVQVDLSGSTGTGSATLVFTVQAAQPATSGITLAPLGKLSAQPFQRLKLAATGADPDAPVFVHFKMKGFNAAIRGTVAGDGSINVLMPPVLAAGKLKAGSLALTASQGEIVSNEVTGLKALGLPRVKKSTGAAAKAFFQLSSAVLSDLRNRLPASLRTTRVLNALTRLQDEADLQVSLIQELQIDKRLVEEIDVISDVTLAVSSRSLRDLDMLALAVFQSAGNGRDPDLSAAAKAFAAAAASGDPAALETTGAAFRTAIATAFAANVETRGLPDVQDQYDVLNAFIGAAAAADAVITADALAEKPFGVVPSERAIQNSAANLLLFTSGAGAFAGASGGYKALVAVEETQKNNFEFSGFVAEFDADIDLDFGITTAGTIIDDFATGIDLAFNNEVQQLTPVITNQNVAQVFDNATVDGDMIQISLNGTVLVPSITLTGSPQPVTLTGLKVGSNVLTIKALNEGSLRPNTATLTIGGRSVTTNRPTGATASLEIIVPGANFAVRKKAVDDRNPQRTTIGAGETVLFKAEPEANWSIVAGGGTITVPRGKESQYMAPTADANVTIRATFDSGETKDFGFAVILPTDIQYTKKREASFDELFGRQANAVEALFFRQKEVAVANGRAVGVGAGMETELTFHPRTVSFGALSFFEDDIAPSAKSPPFSNFSNGHSPAPSPKRINAFNAGVIDKSLTSAGVLPQNNGSAADKAFFTTAGGSGGFTYAIPLNVVGPDGQRQSIGIANQVTTVTSQGTTTVTKQKSGSEFPPASVTRAAGVP